ncbi:MAG: hypothetical protein VX871_05195 [Pseudomonadota bacterium]|nr:hypothetical protein [Pseudomonadota bacterium]
MRTFPRAVAAAIAAMLFASTARSEAPRLSPPEPASLPEAHADGKDTALSLDELRARLDENDRLTVLQALKIALDEVGDGGAFIWHKRHRQLKGVIKPTSAFRDADGRVCRHVIYALRLADHIKQIETIACRQPDGRWTL